MAASPPVSRRNRPSPANRLTAATTTEKTIMMMQKAFTKAIRRPRSGSTSSLMPLVASLRRNPGIP